MAPMAGLPPWFPGNRRNDEGIFVAIEADKRRATDLSAIMMKKFVEDWFPGTKELTRARDGRVIVLARDEKIAKRAEEKATNFYNVCSIKVSRVESMNKCQGVIFDRGLLTVTIDDLMTELKDAKVSRIERIESIKDGKKSPNGMHVITFDTRNLPDTVFAFFIRHNVRTYYPNPLRCAKCCMYGHTRNWCKETIEYCRDCAKPRHEGEACTEKWCRNCPNGGNPPHGSLARECPVRKMEVDIAHLKVDNRLSYGMAKKMYLDNVKNDPNSYADMAKSMAENEAKENAEKLADVKKARENAEKVLEELAIETEKLKKVAAAIIRQKNERDNVQKLIDQQNEPINTTEATRFKPVELLLTDLELEMIEREEREEIEGRKRGASSSEEENGRKGNAKRPPKKVATQKHVMHGLESDYIITPENFGNLSKNMQKNIRKALANVKDPLNPPLFWNKCGKVLFDDPEDNDDVEMATALYDHIVLT